MDNDKDPKPQQDKPDPQPQDDPDPDVTTPDIEYVINTFDPDDAQSGLSPGGK